MVYICIPAYNEERTIGVVLWKIRQVMSEFERDYEVLVVDDGSTDGTGSVMEPYARIMPVHVRRHERREGYARSLEALVREAVERSPYPRRDVVVTLQADFTDEPDDVATLVKRIEGGADVVTGRVRLVADEAPRALRWSRRIWDVLLRRLHRSEQAGDVLSGFRAYRVVALKKAIESVAGGPLLTADGWAANAQLLGRILPHSRRTETVDVQVRYGRLQRESRFEPLRTSLDLFRLLRGGASAPVPAGPPAPAEAAGAATVDAEASDDQALAGTRSGAGTGDRRGRRGGGRRGGGPKGGRRGPVRESA